jgi:hypothetical protein
MLGQRTDRTGLYPNSKSDPKLLIMDADLADYTGKGENKTLPQDQLPEPSLSNPKKRQRSFSAENQVLSTGEQILPGEAGGEHTSLNETEDPSSVKRPRTRGISRRSGRLIARNEGSYTE